MAHKVKAGAMPYPQHKKIYQHGEVLPADMFGAEEIKKLIADGWVEEVKDEAPKVAPMPPKPTPAPAVKSNEKTK